MVGRGSTDTLDGLREGRVERGGWKEGRRGGWKGEGRGGQEGEGVERRVEGEEEGRVERRGMERSKGMWA